MFSIFNKNKTTPKNKTLKNEERLDLEEEIDDPIPSANKINVRNCNDLGNMESGPMRPILTVSE